MNILKLIKKCPIFDNFDDKEINSIFDCLKGRIYKCSRGALIAKEGADIEEIGIVLTGTLLKFTTRTDGSREAQGTLGEGEMFGEVEGYSQSKKLLCSYVAAEDCTILYITVDTIVTQCAKNCPWHHKLLNNVLSYLAGRINTINKDTEYLIIKSMRTKIARLIFDKYIEQGKPNVVRLGINRNGMAEYLNVSRPSMSREMIRMRELGIIEFSKDRITVLNPELLERSANGEKVETA